MRQRRSLERVKRWARNLKRDVVALWLAARDPRVPIHAKAIATIVAAYALSPIDLVPDFIPVIGYLDDLILVPLGIALAIRLIPPDLMDELRLKALAHRKPRSRIGAILVVSIWVAAVAAGSIWWLRGNGNA